MAFKKIADKLVDVDLEGYLTNSQEWNEAIAQALAAQEGLPALTDAHWQVIRFMRQVYAAKGDGPSIRQITRESGVDTKTLYQLFPNGPGKKAAKIAGIPKPSSCV